MATGIITKVMSDSGSNGNGSYIKYADGTMLCWKQMTFTGQSLRTAWGSFYEGSSPVSFGSWAATFVEKPLVFVTTNQGSGTVTCFCEQINSVTTTDAGQTTLCSPVERGSVDVTVAILGVGRWK